jgi:2Fe-2S ferredoxin
MGIIVIKNLGEKTIHFQDSTKTLLRHVQDHYIDWMHACGGKGRCTTCKAKILTGAENLPPLTESEQRYLNAGALGIDERLACQCIVDGNVTILVPDESKFPHVRYTQ